MSKTTRILFVSDIHGSDRLFLKSVNAAPIYKAQVVVIGGGNPVDDTSFCIALSKPR